MRRGRGCAGLAGLLCLAALAWALPASAAFQFSSTDYPLALPATSPNPDSVALADLDGRNGLDIVVTLPNTAQLGVLLNDGTGHFTGPTRTTSCAFPGGSDVELGDLIGPGSSLVPDGKLDAFVACGNVMALPGDGNGGFGPPVTLSMATTSSVIVGTGRLDVIELARLRGTDQPVLVGSVGNVNTQRLCLTYDLVNVNCPAATNGIRIAGPLLAANLEDYAGDGGRDEILTTGLGASTFDQLSVFGLDPGGVISYQPWTNRMRPGGGGAIAAIEAGDVEPDGDVDVLIGHSGDDTISLYRNEPGTLFGSPPAAVPTLLGVYDIEAADLDGDARRDLVVVSAGGAVVVQHGNGDGTFGGPEGPFAVGGGPAVAVTGDLNGDGVRDIVSVHQTGQVLHVLLNQTPQLTPVPVPPAPPPAPAPPPPPPPMPPPPVYVPSSLAAVAPIAFGKGAVSTSVTCIAAAVGSCSGSVALTTTVPSRLLAAGKPKRVTVTLGTRKVTALAPGSRLAVKIPLGKRGKDLLARAGSLVLTVTATIRDDRGERRTTRRTGRIAAPKPPSRG